MHGRHVQHFKDGQIRDTSQNPLYSPLNNCTGHIFEEDDHHLTVRSRVTALPSKHVSLVQQPSLEPLLHPDFWRPRHWSRGEQRHQAAHRKRGTVQSRGSDGGGCRRAKTTSARRAEARTRYGRHSCDTSPPRTGERFTPATPLQTLSLRWHRRPLGRDTRDDGESPEGERSGTSDGGTEGRLKAHLHAFEAKLLAIVQRTWTATISESWTNQMRTPRKTEIGSVATRACCKLRGVQAS